MIAFLRGRLADKDTESVLLEVGGVGYRVFLSRPALSAMPPTGGTVLIHTYLHVREDAWQLYGFRGLEEKELFEQMITVNGVGPKVALTAMSAYDVTTLKRAIASEDVELITTIPGIGKKTAQRLVLELKEKLGVPELAALGSPGSRVRSDALAEVKRALSGLGYTAAEINRALETVSTELPASASDSGDAGEEVEKVDVGHLLKSALKNLAKG